MPLGLLGSSAGFHLQAGFSSFCASLSEAKTEMVRISDLFGF